MPKQNYINYQSEEISLTGLFKTIENEGEGNTEIESPDSDPLEIDYTLEAPKATYLEGCIHGEDCSRDEYRSMLEQSRLGWDYMEVTEEGYFAVIQPREDEEMGVDFTD